MDIKRALVASFAMLAVAGLIGCNSGGSGSGKIGGGSSAESRLAERNKERKRDKAPDPVQDKIVIGVYGDFTGTNSTFGQDTKEGVAIALEEANAAGGVLGLPIEVVEEDTRTDQTQARNAVTKLIQKDKVLAVLGEVASSMSIAGGKVCDQYGVPMITPSSTNPKVTDIGQYIFRVCFLDDFQGTSMARYAVNDLGIKKIAILYDVESDYSVGLKDFFKAELAKLGGEVTHELSFKPADTDYRSQLTTIKNSKAEAIYIPGYYKSVGSIARQARELGISAKLLGGDGWSSSELIPGAGGPGKALEGAYFTDHFSALDPNEDVQNFVKKYEAKFKKKPSALAALAYDAAKVLFQSIESAGSQDRAKLRDAIANIKDFKGVTGTFSINEHGDVLKTITIVQVKGNEFVMVKTLEP
ncbi:MAG: ABC transporter substrate-binding protein [Armatimonadetes bacterium]|nr:ABC transporter substrate-binding protein [Armatimonadota bacterium]